MKKHSFLLLASLIGSLAVGAEVRISSVDEFIQFKDSVNSGSNYLGTTVFLDSDLDLTGKTFEPIGASDYTYFGGVFDGQGHVISNLKIDSSSSRYVGLFGISYELTVRNVILDSSCTVTNSYSDSANVYVGGIIGDIYAKYGPCIIENSVNMGSVSFTGNTNSRYLYLGGIVGYFFSSGYESTVKNCVNYGDFTHSGSSYNSYIGGIAGYSEGYSSYRMYIYNSLNYGTITHSGTTSSSLYLGGITGHSRYTNIENCVSAGKIESTGTAATSYAGSILGYIYSYTSVDYCYITSELSTYNKYGTGTPTSESHVFSYNSTTFELDGSVTTGEYTGTSLIDALNIYSDYYTLRNYSNWLLNKNKKVVTFTINGRAAPISMSYQVMVLPSLASEGNVSFDGWYEDNEYTTLLTSYEVTSDTTLYGKWEENTNNYTITFDTRREGVTVEPITAQFGSFVTLPSDSIRENCSVEFWETDMGYNVGMSLTIPARNIALYAAVWKCTHLKTPEDLIDFSKVVNSGTDTFEGTTVFLDSDLDLTGKTFEPIGNSNSNCFLGTFDGQGHAISNFIMTSSSQHVGLFGKSMGLTITNVILDSSCSVTNSYSGSSWTYAGGLIGECYAYYGPCAIENSVNMARVSFTGDVSGSSLYLGGISGSLYSSSYNSTVKNCANYGDVTHSANSGGPMIGGIVGYSVGSSTSRVYIYNSFNYGTLTHSGTTSSILYIGGVASYTRYLTIENCVSAGKIESTGTASTSYAGSIVGYIYSDVSVSYCYITSELSSYSKYGRGTPSESNVFSYNSATFELDGSVTVGEYTGTSLIDALNAYANTNTDYSHWLLNKNKNAVSFAINGRAAPISINYQIILLPSLASEGSMVFDGWYEDSTYTTPLASYEITSDTALYSLYGVILTVTFDKNGGEGVSFASKRVALNEVYGELPEATKTGYTFNGWFTEQTGGEQVESGSIVTTNSNHTLYAHWTINQYTITFEANGGSKVDPITEDYNTPITLPEPTKTGYTFAYWCSDSGLTTEYKETTMPAENKTLYAKWSINQYTITFDFNNGTVSNVVLDFDSLIEYPEDMTRVGFTFGGWNSKPERMPAENITVTAQWTINQYTITFDFNNGTVSSTVLDYDTAIEYPEDMTRVGFTFSGWSPKPERMPAENITITAQWNITDPVKYVEVMFSKEGMTEEEARKVVEELVPEGTKFSVTIVESDSEGTKVVVKFKNAEAAKEFVETVSASSEAEKSGIKAVEFSSGDKSFATSLGLSVLAYFLAYLLSF